MNDIQKSLQELIDDTLHELEQLKKSKFQAAEINLCGPGEDNLSGQPSNGKIEQKKKKEDEEDEDKEIEKGEFEEQGDRDNTNSEKAKNIMSGKEDAPKDKKPKKYEDEDPKPLDFSKKEDKDDEDYEKHEKEEKKLAQKLVDMHKSLSDTETLLKSYVEERLSPIETQLASILEVVNKMANEPVSAKGVTFKTVPLQKSVNDESEISTLSKSDIANKLLDLKKSGTVVDSLDIAKAETGQDLNGIVQKYKIR